MLLEEDEQRIKKALKLIGELQNAIDYCCKPMEDAKFFLQDYLKCTTHPGVSRIVSDLNDALSAIENVRGDKYPR